MIDISVTGLVKSFEVGNNILDGLTFQVNQGERVGLLGKNGAGKTTLFKILTGEYDYDEGEVAIASGKRLGLISQIPVYPEEYTVEDVLMDAFRHVRRLEEELEQLTEEMVAHPEDSALLRRYDRAMAAFEAADGYSLSTQVNKVANGLGITADQRAQKFSQLSGGEKTRVNLGRLILEDTDILLLDEPTNHLDLHAVEWLEEYLESFKGTVLAISHDRYFLDQVVSRVIEVENGKAEFYSGNYTFFVIEKERRYQERLKQYEKEQAKIAQLTEAADKMHLWAFMGNDKLHKRAFSMEKRIERLRQTEKPTKAKSLDVHFNTREFSGDQVFSVHNLSKAFGERTLFDGVEVNVVGGERIALIGDNGTGKSTFLKILLKEETPDTGKIRFGPQVKSAYLPQIIHFDHPERNLVDTMIWDLNCSAQSARNRLASFQFTGEDVFKPVSALSGGELSRLRLCMLMDDQINLLILDEPTNHLDVASREWIEGAVEEYDGTLLFVSHDRYFIERFATRIWEIRDGQLYDFRGTFKQYRAMRAREEEASRDSALQVNTKQPKQKQEKPKRTGGTKQLEKELGQLERNIAKREEEISALDAQMEENACDYVKLGELMEEKTAAEEALSELYTRWEEVSSRLEGEE
jgi:ATPase subunit of ABC transporter with duplicated ATPase domains